MNNGNEVTALALNLEKCREITNCPEGVDLQDHLKHLAAELSVVEDIHNNAVFITDELYDASPKKVQNIIRSLACLKMPAYARLVAGIKADAQSEVIEWLDAEITAIDTMYRGDPSYEHDAYWMKSEVLGVVELARKAFPAQLRDGGEV